MIECFIYENDKFLLDEARRVKRRGGVTGEYTSMMMDLIQHDNQIPIDQHDFLVSGAALDGCIITTTEALLQKGAKSVTVDLTRCRNSTEVGTRERHTPTERLAIFRKKWPYEGDPLYNPRLFFITSWFGQK